MNDTPPRVSADGLSREQMASALFANLVVQHANMALLYLGRMPHPETGKPELDLEAAQVFIGQLEMLETKTRGNLSPDEADLLRRSLSTTRMAFVDVVENPPDAQAHEPAAAKEPGVATAPAEGAAPAIEGAAASQTEAERKRFTKKY